MNKFNLDLVWYKRTNLISADVINQILAFGTLEDIKKLKTKVGEEKLYDVFVNHPQKFYSKAEFNFIKKYILRVKETVDERRYLQNTPRNIGSQTANVARKSLSRSR